MTGFNVPPRTPRRHALRKRQHAYDGWPHFTSAFPYHCICLQECCQDDGPGGNGCVCQHCPCRYGIDHGTHVESEVFELERQRVAQAQRKAS